MSEQKHTTEPWKVEQHNAYHISYLILGGEKHNQLAQVFNWQDKGFDIRAKENAERIVACVNALAGIPDPQKFVEEAKELKTECQDWQDELTGARKHIEIQDARIAELEKGLKQLFEAVSRFEPTCRKNIYYPEYMIRAQLVSSSLLARKGGGE